MSINNQEMSNIFFNVTAKEVPISIMLIMFSRTGTFISGRLLNACGLLVLCLNFELNVMHGIMIPKTLVLLSRAWNIDLFLHCN